MPLISPLPGCWNILDTRAGCFIQQVHMDALCIPATVLGSGNIVVNKTEKSKGRHLPLLRHPIKSFKIKQVKTRHTFFFLLEILQWKIWKDTKKKVKVIQNPFPQR